MLVSAIVAADEGNIIGDGLDIPWHLGTDLQYFKRLTLGHHIIMGRKTFESIGRPLPKRTNIVLTRDAWYAGTGIVVAHNIQEALEMAFDNKEEEVFIIGGGEIYRQSMPFWDKIYLTRVFARTEGTVHFPAIHADEWKLLHREEHPSSEKDDFPFAFEVYSKIKSEEE